MAIAGNSMGSSSFLTHNSLEYLDLSHYYRLINIKNLLCVFPYQYVPEFNSDGLYQLGGRG